MNDLGRRIAALSPEKRVLLALRLMKTGAVVANADEHTIPRRGLTSPCPLSFAQQRLWFVDQLEPDSPLYNIAKVVRLNGALDVDALQKAFHTVIARHEALRTTFAAVEDNPVQIIAERPVKLAVIDLSTWPEAKREAEVDRLLTAEARRPFNLSQDLMLRATVLRLGEQAHVLLIVMHHIASDGWSMGILLRELVALYAACCLGQPVPLPELPLQYADFAVWQRHWLQGERLERQLAYWRQQLQGLPVLQLPTDRPRPAVQNYQGARQSLMLPQSISDSLKALSHREGVTLFMTLLAALQTLLHRYTGQEDIVVGAPVAGRTRTEAENLIGFFVNTLVLRTDLAGNPTFRELLGRVRETALGAYTHQDLPFEKLVEELNPQRDLSRNPLFDVMLNMTDSPQTELTLPGLAVGFSELTGPMSKFLLTLYVEQTGSELNLQLAYQSAVLCAERVTCMLQQFHCLLEQIVAAPEKPIGSYSLATPESRSLLPDPSAVLPEPGCELVTNLFAVWAHRVPAQVAVRQGELTWTYDQLAVRAKTLARALRATGVRRGDVVAVLGRRSFGFIVSVMAVLLSGGVLLLIDRHLPPDRQRLMLREANAKHLLLIDSTRPEGSWDQALSPLSVTAVDPHCGWPLDSERDPQLEAIPLPDPAPDDAAYIFFTSGTTGVPKGVLGCHKGLAHFLAWQRQEFAVRPQDRCAQLTSPSFDPVLRDIFLPLTSGATLCLPQAGGDLGTDWVLPWLEHEQISLLHTVPALAQSWLSSCHETVSLRAMRWVFFAGEPLPEALVRRWSQAFPEAGGIVNLYGPTETTLAKCFYRVQAEPSAGVQPVGWPLPATQALVFRENNQICGIGEPGEIVLRTPFRSLGYINASEENHGRFVKNPFRDDEKDLLYYTGDRGRYRPDGSLEVLGRFDDQVKIRGVRVEPDEVAAILSRHPAVGSCAVLAARDEQDHPFLTAYVVPAWRHEATIPELRAYLGKQLPAVMIPAAFVLLEQLPLTPNGKLDRRALPTPGQIRSEPEEAFVVPRTLVEEEVARVWAEVLGLVRIGIRDNFFALGGHSLLATQVISRLRKLFQVEISLRRFFETPTIAELATTIAHAKESPAELRAPTLSSTARELHRVKKASRDA
jgi:amino acid adenylation domain-containing protein